MWCQIFCFYSYWPTGDEEAPEVNGSKIEELTCQWFPAVDKRKVDNCKKEPNKECTMNVCDDSKMHVFSTTPCHTLTHIHTLLLMLPSDPETWTLDLPVSNSTDHHQAYQCPAETSHLQFCLLQHWAVTWSTSWQQRHRLNKYLLRRISCCRNLINSLCCCCCAEAVVFFYRCISISLWKDNILRSATPCYSRLDSHWYVVRFPNYKWKIIYFFQTVVHWWNKCS